MNQQTKTKQPTGSPPTHGEIPAGTATATSESSTTVPPVLVASDTVGPKESSQSVRETADSHESISKFHAEKLEGRRYEWVMEWRILGFTALALVAVAGLAVGSYVYHSSRTPATLLSRADQAAEEGNLDEEVRWLNTYLLMRPDDSNAFVRAALAADKSAESGTRQQLAKRIQEARKRISLALAFLPDTDANRETRADLRRRMIERQLQLGGYEYKDVERQIIELNPGRDDAQAYRWMAQAVLGQVQELLYQIRPQSRHDRATEFWAWLADQPPGLVLIEAVRRNPDDLDLISSLFAMLASHPEHFGTGVKPGPESDKSFQQSVAALDGAAIKTLQETLDRLQARSDSRSRILLYRYAMMMGNVDQALTVINQAAEDAANRLSALVEVTTDSENEDAQTASGDQTDEPAAGASEWKLTDQEREAIADYEAVYIAARAAMDQLRGGAEGQETPELQQARGRLKLLRDLGIDSVRVSPEAVKNTYLSSGALEQIAGDVEAAITNWQAGLEVLNSDNLDLRGSIAWALSQQADSEKQRQRAEKAVQEFERIVDAKGKELLEMTSGQASPAQRSAIADQVENARWRSRIARAQLLASGKRSAANDQRIIDTLRGIVERELKLDQQAVLTGVALLTDAYQRQSAWDLAAETLEAAADKFPDNQGLVEASGNAWTRAGNRAQAQKQWQRARLSNNPRTRVAVLEAEFANQLRQIPDQRDIESLRAQVRALRDLLATSPGSFEREKLRLQLLEAQLPPEQSDVLAEQYLRSVDLADRVVELADANPDDLSLQTYAAERLAASGQLDRAEQIVQRVQQSQSLDAAQQTMLRARLLSAADKHNEAAKTLLDYVGEHDDSPAQMALQAADAANRSGQIDLVEQALLSIPESRRSPYAWYQLYQAAVARGETDSAEDYLKQLHAAERYNEPPSPQRKPAYSLFIEAKRLANKLLARGRVQWDDSQLRKAERVVQQLQNARPHWGNATALRGWLAYASGNLDTAIEFLQRGINAGDTQLRTRQLLWQALIAVGRDEEAQQQIELASIASQTDVDPYDEIEIGLDLRRGRYTEALGAAKQVAESKPDDPTAQLVYAKFALATYDRVVSGNADAEQFDKEELLESARQAIDVAEANAVEPAQRYAVASTRLQMQIGLKDDDAIRAELKTLADLELPAADRLLLEAKAYVALGEVDQAIEKLEASNERRPAFRTQALLVRLLRSRGRGKDSLEVLQQAFKQDPTNPTLRTELATQLAASGESIDWDEIAKLLNDDEAVTTQNRFVYALLLATRGNEFQRKEAVRLLRSLSGTRAQMANDASRVQAALMLELAEDGDSLSDSDKQRYRDEARQILERLAGGDSPQPVDITRYCTFLIQSGQPEDLDEAQTLLSKLKTIPGAAIEVLKIEMFLARETGQDDQLPDVVEGWVNDPQIAEQSKAKGDVETAAGDALLQAGFINEGIDWFRRAYEANENAFPNYVVALSRVGRFKQAADISAENYAKSNSARAAILLVESLLADASDALADRHLPAVEDAVSKFPENQALLEGVATLEMQTGNTERAIALYQKILKIDPRRIRTLNNLAMLLAEVPGRALEGLKPIDQALRLAGDNPELLDTKGTVLLRAGKLPEAKAVFESAIEKSDEPRFVFHLIITLMEMGEQNAATKLWRSLDLDRLDPKGLTLEEQATLKDYRRRFGTSRKDNATRKEQT